MFNGVVNDVTGSRVIPEIDMSAAQTGSNDISAHRTAKTKFQRLYPCFRGPAVQRCCRQCHQKLRYTGYRYGAAHNRK